MATAALVEARDHFVFVNGLRLHYCEWGDRAAPPVVLLHGGSAHAHWWDFLAAALVDTYRLLALDLRGHGDSAAAQPPAYRIADYAADLSGFVDSVAPNPAALVGHSLGGMIAAAYAAQAPHLNALVLVDSPLRMTAKGVRYLTRLRSLLHPLYQSRDQAIQRFRLLPIDSLPDECVRAHVAAYGIRELPGGHWTLKFDRETLAHHEPLDLLPIFQRLACPLLIVRGADSKVLPPAAQDAIRMAAPHVQITHIAQARHHVMLDNPLELARVIGAFLGRVGGPTATKDSTSL